MKQRILARKLTGTVNGLQASFGYHLFDGQYYYLADVVVSADGRRMTDRFHGTSDWLSYTTAWRRIADDQAWLVGDVIASPLLGGYELRLDKSDSGADEFVADRTYSLRSSRMGIAGDLGSFWLSEMKRTVPGGTIQVGPAPLTSPELVVQMDIDGNDDSFTSADAVTGSGHRHLFRATPWLN